MTHCGNIFVYLQYTCLLIVNLTNNLLTGFFCYLFLNFGTRHTDLRINVKKYVSWDFRPNHQFLVLFDTSYKELANSFKNFWIFLNCRVQILIVQFMINFQSLEFLTLVWNLSISGTYFCYFFNQYCILKNVANQIAIKLIFVEYMNQFKLFHRSTPFYIYF